MKTILCVLTIILFIIQPVSSQTRSIAGKGVKQPSHPTSLTMTTTGDDELTIFITGENTVTVNWGDGSPKESLIVSGEIPNTHTYSVQGNYDIEMTGNLSSITYLYASNCFFTAINPNACANLIELDCSYNKIETLMVPFLDNIEAIYCSFNNMTESAVTALIESLPDRSETTTGNPAIWPQNEGYSDGPTQNQANYLGGINWPLPK